MRLLKNSASVDVLKDKPSKIILSVCTPLIICSLIAVFTSSITNKIYSVFCPEYFTVYGTISVAIVAMQITMGCVISACWIKTAYFFSQRVAQDKTPFFANAIYSILFIQIILTLIFLSLKNLVFKWLNVPEYLFDFANKYYVICVCAYLLASLGTFSYQIINGVGKPHHLFFASMISQSGTLVVASIMLAVFKTSVIGCALILPLNGVLSISLALIVFKKRNVCLPKTKKDFAVNFALIKEILSAGAFMAFQSIMCQVGEFCISYQTNNLLDVEYRTMLGVQLLPFSAVLTSFSNVCMVFIPANYKAENYQRVKKFVKQMTLLALGYAVFCAFAYTLVAIPYFNSLFTNPVVIEYGKYYWFAYGVATIPVSFIYILRFYLDCVGRNKTAMVTGFMQMVGAMLGAFWLIPSFGTIGRAWAPFSTWFVPAVYLIVACAVLNKKIFPKQSV